MNRTKVVVIVLACVAAIVCGGSFCTSALAQIESEKIFQGQQFLVLKNGNVIHGTLEHQSDGVVVHQGNGSRLIIANEKADFCCRSLNEVYWGRLARIRARDVDGQVALFYWCLEQQLLTQAQNQIDVLQTTTINASKLNFLNRQLNMSFHKLTAESDQRIAAVQDPPTSFFSDPEPIFRQLPSLSSGIVSSGTVKTESEQPAKAILFQSIRSPTDSENTQVLQVGFESSVEDQLTSSSKNPMATTATQSATVRDLDLMTRSMPPGSLAMFRRKVEGVLIQNCASCHRADMKTMPLFHRGRRQPTTRRMSQRNLHGILQLADRQSPLNSSLLAAATTAHGGDESPALSLDSQEYENLVRWLVMISDQPNQAIEPIQPDRFEISPQEAKKIQHIQAKPGKLAVQPTGLPSIGKIPELKEVQANFVPQDEFDPEIFNRLPDEPND